MRGIKFIKEICREFNLKLIKQGQSHKTLFYYYISGSCDVLLYFYRKHIYITITPYEEQPFVYVKYKEKYKIKQLIHEALSE